MSECISEWLVECGSVGSVGVWNVGVWSMDMEGGGMSCAHLRARECWVLQRCVLASPPLVRQGAIVAGCHNWNQRSVASGRPRSLCACTQRYC